MKTKDYSAEQVVQFLYQVDAKLASGSTVEQVCRDLSISDATYHKWRKQYGFDCIWKVTW